MVEPAPILIHGVLRRSGTNFLNRLMLLHEDVAETDSNIRENFFLHFSEDLECYGERLFEMWSNPRWKGTPFSADEFYAQMGQSLTDYLRGQSEIPQHAHLVTKTPTVKHIQKLDRWFPRAKIVFIVRDPRDIAYSAESTWQRPVQKTATEWNEAILQLLDFETKHDADSYFLVRYEDLVADPRQQMEMLVDYLGLSQSRYQWDQVDDLQVSGSSELGWTTENKPSSFQSVGRWTKWPDAKRQKFESVVQPLMKCFGYQVTDESDAALARNRDQRIAEFARIDPSRIQTSYRGDLFRRLVRRLNRFRKPAGKSSSS